MSWLSRLLSRFTRKTRARLIRARYDAALTTTENKRHWANADGLSPNTANDSAVRQTLRNRARYEVANNSYARGVVSTYVNYVVGVGPTLQLMTEDEDFNAFIENEFYAWSEAVGLRDKLWLMLNARIVDGESFAILVNNPKLDTPVKLDLRLIEADMVSSPELSTDTSVDGIFFDVFGNPERYRVLRRHPGDTTYPYEYGYDDIDAAYVIHWFHPTRPGQARGIPELTPALPLFAQLRRYTLAVIAAAETAADFAGVLYTDGPPVYDAESVKEFTPIEVESRALLTLPGGWKMSQLKAEQPATTYAEFKREILTEIVRCLSMPYNIAACDSSDYNYASGRLDHQTFFRVIRLEQDCLERKVLRRIFNAWFDEAYLIPKYVPNAPGSAASWDKRWFWDGVEHVDPLKEANAQAIRLANNTTTLAAEYARVGKDWQLELTQRARELQLMRELGISNDLFMSQSNEQQDEQDE